MRQLASHFLYSAIMVPFKTTAIKGGMSFKLVVRQSSQQRVIFLHVSSLSISLYSLSSYLPPDPIPTSKGRARIRLPTHSKHIRRKWPRSFVSLMSMLIPLPGSLLSDLHSFASRKPTYVAFYAHRLGTIEGEAIGALATVSLNLCCSFLRGIGISDLVDTIFRSPFPVLLCSAGSKHPTFFDLKTRCETRMSVEWIWFAKCL